MAYSSLQNGMERGTHVRKVLPEVAFIEELDALARGAPLQERRDLPEVLRVQQKLVHEDAALCVAPRPRHLLLLQYTPCQVMSHVLSHVRI